MQFWHRTEVCFCGDRVILTMTCTLASVAWLTWPPVTAAGARSRFDLCTREVLLYIGIDWITYETTHTLRTLSYTKYPYWEYTWALFHTQAGLHEAANKSIGFTPKKNQLSGDLEKESLWSLIWSFLLLDFRDQSSRSRFLLFHNGCQRFKFYW